MPDLDRLTIGAASRLLDERELSAVELLEATLARIADSEPLVHAYCLVDADGAREAARTADLGRRASPLQGIPFAVKDVLDTAGLETAAGSRVLAGRIPGADAEAVRRLRTAGAVLVGKHVTHEFACGQDVPPTRNPWNLAHYPGGSSAGGGVSVQVGSSLLALGTDAGGSVRKPACVTATVGLKATHGRVSGSGTVRAASAPSLDHVGTFTRTVADAALALGALAGFDAADPRSLDAPVPDYTAALDDGAAGLRLGVDASAFGGERVDPDVLALVEAAYGELEAQGATLVPVSLPSLPRLALPACFAILLAEVASAHRSFLARRPDAYVRETRLVLETAALLPASYVQGAHAARARLVADVATAFRDARLDALLTPTLPITSMPIAELDTPRDLPALIPFTCPWNVTGQPALSVPCGLTPAGLPAGLQIVGRPLDEETVLRVGHAYQRETDWHERRAPLAVAA